MSKYHINKKGKVEECRATVRACPFGEENHIEANSPGEAIEKFEKEYLKDNVNIGTPLNNGTCDDDIEICNKNKNTILFTISCKQCDGIMYEGDGWNGGPLYLVKPDEVLIIWNSDKSREAIVAAIKEGNYNVEDGTDFEDTPEELQKYFEDNVEKICSCYLEDDK